MAPFGPYSLAGYTSPGNNMPSADSRYALGSPCGSLTRGFRMLPHPFFVFLTFMVRLVRRQDTGFPDAGDFVHRFSLYSGLFADAVPSETQRASRGELGYFQRTIVRYTRLDLVTNIGLYPVLRTRPDLTPPQICLPSTFWVRGIPVRRPTPLPLASFRRTLL